MIPCRSYEMENVYWSSESHRKCTTTFCRDKQSFPTLSLVKLGGGFSGSCCSPSKAELVAGSRDENWFKTVGISFRSKKMQLFLRLENLPQDFQERWKGVCRWQVEGCGDFCCSSCTFLPWPQHSWCLVSCLWLGVILWVMEHIMHKEA